MSMKKKHEEGQHASSNAGSIFNNAKAFENNSPNPVDITMSNTGDDEAARPTSTNNTAKGKRKRNGDGKESFKDGNTERSPPAKKTPSSSSDNVRTLSSSAVGFAKASLAKTNLLSTPKKTAAAAGPGSAKTPPPPPSKKSSKKGVVADEAVRKTTCRRCAEHGLTCKPHAKEPERYRCNKCIGDKMKAVDCVMIDAVEAAAVGPGAAADTMQSDEGGREVTPTPAGPASRKEASMQTPTPAQKPSLSGPPPPTPVFTPGRKASQDPPTTAKPTPDPATSALIPSSVLEKQQSEEIKAYYEKHSTSSDHDHRAMSQLLWSTHRELLDKVLQVQQAERKYNDLRRGQRDLTKALQEFMGVPKLRDILEKAVQDVEKEDDEKEKEKVELSG